MNRLSGKYSNQPASSKSWFACFLICKARNSLAMARWQRVKRKMNDEWKRKKKKLINFTVPWTIQINDKNFHASQYFSLFLFPSFGVCWQFRTLYHSGVPHYTWNIPFSRAQSERPRKIPPLPVKKNNNNKYGTQIFSKPKRTNCTFHTVDLHI